MPTGHLVLPAESGYRYTGFCEVYRRWFQRRGLSMRQVDHTGDPTIGELIPVQLFVGVTNAVVCDQLKSSVVVPCPYARGLQRTYDDYRVVVLMLRSPRRIAAGR